MFNKSKVILITGCCGTTGTSLVKYILSNTKDRILGVDNFYKEGSEDNYKEILDFINSNKKYQGRFYFACQDISEDDFVQSFEEYMHRVSDKDAIKEIYNLAAIVETPRFYDSPYETYTVNCVSAIRLYRLAQQYGVKKFVNASSSEIYGHASEFPTKESTPSHYDSVETSTRWSYAHGKILTEYVMNELYDKYGKTKVCHLRYANVYGEHDLNPTHVIPYFLNCIHNGKEIHMNSEPKKFKRAFLHNDDSTLGTYLAMKFMVPKHAYNIGSNEEVTIDQLFCKCFVIYTKYLQKHNLVNNSAPDLHADLKRPGDPVRRKLDTTRASHELGFECKVSLDEGIERMVDAIVKRYKGKVKQCKKRKK